MRVEREPPAASEVLAVVVGGALGAGARWLVDQAIPWHPADFPWATFAVNVTGCLLIGAVVTWLETRPKPRWARPLLATGVLGGYTTMSALAVESVRLLDQGSVGVFAAYVVGSFVAGVAAVLAGVRIVEAMAGRGSDG